MCEELTRLILIKVTTKRSSISGQMLLLKKATALPTKLTTRKFVKKRLGNCNIFFSDVKNPRLQRKVTNQANFLIISYNYVTECDETLIQLQIQFLVQTCVTRFCIHISSPHKFRRERKNTKSSTS